MKKIIAILIAAFCFGSAIFAQTVKIGTQVWTTKNLNVSTFRNGDTIPEVKTNEEWIEAARIQQPAWCYYENDSMNGAKYGKLYNWYAMNDTRGLAPIGYHIPSDVEWKTLVDFIGKESDAGKKMKSTSGWNSCTMNESKTCPNCANWNVEYRRKVPCHTCKDTRYVDAGKVTHSGNGSDSYGFSALPGGIRAYDKFYSIGEGSNWWDSTVYDYGDVAWFRSMSMCNGSISRYNRGRGTGLSVRCVKD